MRICRDCKIEKPETEFKKHYGKITNLCKRCDYLRDKLRPGFKACKKRAKLVQKDKRRIHKRVQGFIKRGTIKRQPCVLCGSDINIEAHHNDYTKPLEITWLCRVHHQWLHKMLFKFKAKYVG